MPPERARAVVIGGGVIGCSCLYHLAKQGWTDSVLVEQFQLTHGSTWHSAGLVGQLRSSISLTRMMQYSVGLYAELKELTGNDPGWHQLGGLRLASSQPRLEEIRRQASWAKTFGLPMEIVSAEEAQALFPPMSTDGVLAAAFIPDDGYLDPSQLTFALADGARRLGAQIEVRTRVTGIETRDGRVCAVETDKGRIECEVVVDAAGMYARQVAELVGVDVPIIPFGHQYLVTEPFDPPLEPLPTLRDPDNLIYFRTEVGGLVMGGYERKPAPWAIDGIPDGFEAKLLPQEWERMEELFTNAIHRVPAMENAEVKMFFNGPEAFTPDADFLLGETDVPGFWIAAGGCAHGLAGAGGVGKIDERVDRRRPSRVGRVAARLAPLRPAVPQPRVHARALVRGAVAVLRHQVPGRGAEGRAAPSCITGISTAYRAGRVLRGEGRLGARQLVRVERRGRRRVAAAARLGGRELVAGDRGGGARRARGDRALRPVVVLEARGARPGRARVPRAAVREPHRPAGRHDRLHAAAEPARRDRGRPLGACGAADDRFMLVTGTAFGTHDRAWLERNMPRDGSVYVNDVTSAFACLCLWGPKVRERARASTIRT